MFLLISVVFDVRISDRQFFLLNSFFIVAIILLVYNLNPDPSLDLYRYFNYLDSIKNVELKNLFSQGSYQNTVIIQIYFYLVAQTNNYFLLSTITSTIIFSLLFFICFKFKKKFDVTFQEIAFYILAVISVATLSGIFSGIRQNLAWILLACAIYNDFFKESRHHYFKYVLYLIPTLIHVSVLPFIFIRMVLPIFNRFRSLKYIVLLWPTTVTVLDLLKPYLPTPFQLPIDKLISYSSLTINVTPKFITAFLGYIIVLFFIYKTEDKIHYKIHSRKYYVYYTIVVFFGAASLFVPTLFVRTFEYIIYISLPLISIMFKSKFRFKNTSVYLLIFLFLLLFYYVDLHSGYPFL